jgi:hypothetical protein
MPHIMGIVLDRTQATNIEVLLGYENKTTASMRYANALDDRHIMENM